MAQTLGRDIPFTTIATSEVFLLSMSKKDALAKAFQRSMGIRIKEGTELVEGEVVKFTGVSGVCTTLFVDKISALTKTTFQATKTGKLTIKTTDIKTIYDNTIDALSKEKALRHNH